MGRTESSPTATPIAPAATELAHVLVVDDADAIRTFLAEVLRLAAFRVTAVDSGAAALQVCADDPPVLVLTDLVMEPMSGEELVQILGTRYPTIVSVVVTGHGSVERTVDLMRLGAFDVLTKPCAAAEVLDTVEKALVHRTSRLAKATESTHFEASITDDRDRLIQEKLAMIGKLAAGVAHELNNPLDAVLRCVRMTQERVSDDPEATEYLDIAHTGLRRMADIVQSLLTFSREAAFEQTPQRLDELVAESITSVSLALGKVTLRVENQIGGSLAALPVPRGLHQVLTNLLRNASDACEGKGAILVRGHLADGRLILEVADEGPGIPDDVLPRVFEPFFTTKDPGKGTGLGLPISARLVEKFGGAMGIACPRAGGTVVTISLPTRSPGAGALLEAS